MLRERNEQIQVAARGVDLAVCVAAFFLAYQLRISLAVFAHYPAMESLESHSWLLAASLILHFLIYPHFKFYESIRLKPPSEVILMVIKAGLTEFFTLGTMVFLTQSKTTS